VGHLFFEILLVFGAMKKFCENSVELIGLENWRQANQQGRGAIYLSSHVGNWEIMAAKGALAGMDLMIVTKHLKPEWLHLAIERGRAACGVSGTYEPRTLRDALAHFKKKGTVGFILDQYAGPPIGVRVPVFGMPVGTASAIAMLAKRTGAPVLPVVNYRRPDGTMVVDIRPELPWITDENSNREVAINTARYASVLEGDIRSHPEQWLWIHNRFKGDLGPLQPDEWIRSRARTRVEV
ncbi:MAG: lysophospholipid acyltransferase family protein, partial [Bdellovibrionota bacterium]